MTVKLRYGSVCSGIEAATVAWHPLGWEPAFFSEIEPAPRAVLAHHYPDVPLHGDFTTIGADEYGAIDLLVGGTPCQSFSVAGLRGGLDDDRGNLALEFLRLAQRKRPKWLVWENVPGVLSSNGGRDFGSILGGLVELGYGFAYRVLDAQYFGVAQRRRRVFVVGYLGDWRRAAAVLFERHSLQGHSAPSRKAGQRVADTLAVGANQCSGRVGDITEDSVARCLTARGAGGQNLDPETANLVPEVATTLTASRSSTQCPNEDTTLVAQKITDQGHLIPEIAGTMKACANSGGWSNSVDHAAAGYMIPDPMIAFDTAQITSKTNRSKAEPGLPASTLSKNSNMHVAIPINTMNAMRSPDADPSTGCGIGEEGEAMFTLTKGNHHAVAFSIMPMNSGKDYKARETDVAQPLMAGGPVGGNQGGDYIVQQEVVGTLTRASSVGGTVTQQDISAGHLVVQQDVKAFAQNVRDEVRYVNGDGAIAGALAADAGMKQTTYVHIEQDAISGVQYGEHQQDKLHSEHGIMSTLVGGSNDNAGHYTKTAIGSAVRRLTPVECERLQGFPDNYTLTPFRGKPMADGPRYKALGNSMAVPVMRWIGERIAKVEEYDG